MAESLDSLSIEPRTDTPALPFPEGLPSEAKYSSFLSSVGRFIPKERIYTDSLRTLAWGTDAGFYRLVPRIVIRAGNEEEVSRILSEASSQGLPVTFRAAGTSLSGQSITESILVVAGKNWERYSFDPSTGRIVLQPGLVGAAVNKVLAPFGRKFGPDPASIGSCMVGGIVMNNASGMSCGTHANSDRMMVSCRLVFYDGTILDTGSPESRRSFRLSHPQVIEGIEALRDEIQSNSELSERIRYKYSIKNVTGLNLFPFVRFFDPFDILSHLIVGSEGTLAFLSEVTMDTLPIPAFSACAMIYFDTISDAAKGVVAIKKLPISAAELLDKRSLASVDDPVWVERLREIEGRGDDPSSCDLTAVLTQTDAETYQELQDNIAAIREALAPFGVDVSFTTDAPTIARYWAIRAGIFPTVGGLRAQGTTCLIEDVAFHIEDLPSATEDLSALLDKHGYTDSCIYGHALEGNFHFIINQSFSSEEEVSRYEAMIRDVAELVVGKYDGSLKAEHGTGRNMAPFVKYEWGEEAYNLMVRVKALFDPLNLLNPGVIFNPDPRCYLRDFKALPVLTPGTKGWESEKELSEAYTKLNKCIECGFCEVNCLTCGLSLSPRTRIVAQREITSLQQSGSDPGRLRTLLKEYLYQGNRTCAGDGLCSTSCPMGINVAHLTHQVRRERTLPGTNAYKAGEYASEHFEGVKGAIRGALRLAEFGRAVIGTPAMTSFGRTLHRMGLPLWTPSMPRAYKIPRNVLAAGPVGDKPKVVYLPSCINQTMGLQKDAPYPRPLVEETKDLLEKAGYEVVFPRNLSSLCCGTIWESKGMPDIADRRLCELDEALWEASDKGRYPVFCDQSPCLHRMKKGISRMRLYEPAEFIWTFLRDTLSFDQTTERVALHITCSMRLMGKADLLVSLAGLCSTNVVVPEGIGCCGFAGDKGMTNPEVNAYALRKLSSQVEGIEVGYSNSRTCEIGLQTSSGIPYVSIVYLVNSHTHPIGR